MIIFDVFDCWCANCCPNAVDTIVAGDESVATGINRDASSGFECQTYPLSNQYTSIRRSGVQASIGLQAALLLMNVCFLVGGQLQCNDHLCPVPIHLVVNGAHVRSFHCCTSQQLAIKGASLENLHQYTLAKVYKHCSFVSYSLADEWTDRVVKMRLHYLIHCHHSVLSNKSVGGHQAVHACDICLGMSKGSQARALGDYALVEQCWSMDGRNPGPVFWMLSPIRFGSSSTSHKSS